MGDAVDNKGAGIVTGLFTDARRGDRAAFDRLFQLAYEELKSVARRELRRERAGDALHATGLVHEAYLKLMDQAEMEWQGRAHFLAIAARAMRQILIDYSRRRLSRKRGGDWQRVTLTSERTALKVQLDELLALDSALSRLGSIDERARRVVEYRFFGGLSEKEIACLLGVTERTVQREWARARAWLYKELYPAEN